MQIAIVDDHRLLVQALGLTLEAHGMQVVVPDLADPSVLLAGLVEGRPDLILLDLDLGDAGNGADLVRPLVEAGLRVLVVSASTDVEQVAHAIELGAVGVVAKNGELTVLVEAILAAARGREVMAPRERLHLIDAAGSCRERRMAQLAPFGHLTRRECEVLRELTEGHLVAEIARRSVVSEATVRAQVRCILTKLGVRSQLEAVAVARRTGWH